jgi:hypothetical protein
MHLDFYSQRWLCGHPSWQVNHIHPLESSEVFGNTTEEIFMELFCVIKWSSHCKNSIE